MEQFSLTDIKKKNLSDVYHYIYMNPSCSKQDIATALSVSLPTRNPVLVRRRTENRTLEVRKSILRSTKTRRYIEIQRLK